MSLSIVLTVHNKEALLRDVLEAMLRTVTIPVEVVVVLDGCTDRSTYIAHEVIQQRAGDARWVVVETPDVFETRANNAGMRAATGDHVAIVQDDQVMDEVGWDARLLWPFEAFGDVFAVTGRTAHGWTLNPAAEDTMESQHRGDRWCDLLSIVDVADVRTVPRDVFAVRDSVNRGPLVLAHADLAHLDYLEEAFAPQDSDEHDLMYRAHARLGKVCGFVNVGWHSRPEWGGTRDALGCTKPWMYLANHKNVRLLYARHAEAMKARRCEDRRLP